MQIKIPQKEWGSVITKYPPDSVFLNSDDFTQGSQNFDSALAGVLVKRAGGTYYNSSPLANPVVDQYEAVFSDGTHHLLVMSNGTLYYTTGNQIFNSITSGYSTAGNMEFATYLDRVYFGNGINPPQVYDKNTTYGGVTYSAPMTKVMGSQVPTTPSASLNTDSTTNQVPAGQHTYKITHMYYGFEESNGSPASSAVNNDATHTSNIVTIPTGGYGVTARNIYRDNSDGNWLLVGSVNDNTTTTFTDKTATATLPIPILNGLPPTFSQIIQFRDRLWTNTTSNPFQIWFSEAGLPDIFRPTNFLPTKQGDPFIGFAVHFDRIIIFNRYSMGQILGSDSLSFAYSEIEGGIGCVDNRSIQIRIIDGVPELIWLSDKGFYSYNGSSVVYLSDDIEDEVNFNITQGAVVRGSNTQNTQLQYQAGTITPSIDINSNPNIITTINPTKTFQTQSDWEGGSSGTTNIETNNPTGPCKVPTRFVSALSSGSLSGNAVITGGKLQLVTISGFTGESTASGGYQDINFGPGAPSDHIWQPFIPPVSGTLSQITINFVNDPGSGGTGFLLQVVSDNGGQAEGGSVLFSQSFNVSQGQAFTASASPNIHLTGGNKYWYGVVGNGGTISQVQVGTTQFSGGAPHKFKSTSGEQSVSYASFSPGYSFSHDPVSSTGQWTSNIYDSGSIDVSTGMNVTWAGSTLSNTTNSLYVEGSNDQITFDVSQLITVFGNQTLTTSGRRYWRLRIVQTTNDNRITPSVNDGSILFFNITGIWISQPTDCTTDVTSYISLTSSISTPAGTTALVQAASSPDNVTYTSYGALGSIAVQRYVKIKITLTTTSVNDITPQLNSVTLSWSVTGTFTSQAIDTGITPAGWDIFQSVYSLNGGTIAFSMRSASTSGGLSTATYFTVTNGNVPPSSLPVLRFVQWKAIISSTANNLPMISSTTINWFISSIRPSRVVSIFYSRTYFLAAQEYGQLVNNVILQYDDRRKWRIWKGINVNTFSYFFNKPYYGSALTGQLVNFNTGNTDPGGVAIALDLRTKAWDFGKLDKPKILRKVYIKGINTGAVYTVYFSIDGGKTFNQMLVETQNSASQLTTDTSGTLFVHRLSPSFDSSTVVSGKTVMFRITENTINPVELHEFVIEGWVLGKEAKSGSTRG